MERFCRCCGQPYRGLVCQVCHPRRSRRRAENKGVLPTEDRVELSYNDNIDTVDEADPEPTNAVVTQW